MRAQWRTPIRALAALAVAASLLLMAGETAAADSGRIKGDPRTPIPVFVLEKGRFTAFDTPGDGTAEFPRINDRGQIVDRFTDLDGNTHGLVRSPRGRFESVDVPGAKVTVLNDINNRGEIVGNTCGETHCAVRVGFLRDARGQFRTIRVPGSVETQALGIDDRGRVVGDYLDSAGTYHGYRWEDGRFTTIDVPRAAATQILAINDRGQMVGAYVDDAGAVHGFFRSAWGHTTTIDAPNAPITIPWDLNNRGQVVGYTTTALDLANAEVHGFVLRRGPGDAFTRVDVPGAPRTAATGIDDQGRIVGAYEDPNATPSLGRNLAMPTPAPAIDKPRGSS